MPDPSVRKSLLPTALMALCAFLPAGAAVEVRTLATGFSGSGDVAVDAEGNIHVGDYGDTLSQSTGSQVLRFTPEGVMSVFAQGFTGASGNSFDAAGNLYQSNIQAGAVMRVDPSGTVSTYVSGLSGGTIGNAFDSQGNLYVNTCSNHRIHRVDPSGNASLFVFGFPLSCPNGLTVDDQDNLYAVNFNNGSIVKITPDGQMSILAVTPGSVFRPSGGNGHVTFGNGVLYVASNATSQIFQVTLDGELTVLAGSGQRGHADGDPLAASFSFPNGIDLSPDGRLLYVNEAESTAGTVLNGNTFPLNPARLRVIELFEAEPEGEPINAGMTGAWFDPDTPGQGLLFEPLTGSGEFFGAWFTFEDTAAKVGASGQRWFTLQGSFEGARAELTLFLNAEGVFDDPEPITTSAVGSAVLHFESCTEATLEYAFDDGPAGTLQLNRLTPDTLCHTLATP